MSTFYTKLPDVIDGDIAYAQDVNDINDGVDVGFELVEAAFTQNIAELTALADAAAASASAANASEANAATSESNAATSESNAEDYGISALASKNAAATSASNASASESAAATSASNADASDIAAAVSRDAAALSASEASTSAGLAFGYKDETLIARDVTQGYMMTADVHATRAEAAETNAEGFALNAEDYATIAQSVACQNLEAVENFLLDSIGIVDVKIYDTSKDPDGGAWREKTEQTSWYREPLNTATRGRTRKFPAVVAIIAETDKVTILDLTEPDLPMWMVFYGSAVGYYTSAWAGINVAQDISAVMATYGILTVASSAVTGGLSTIDFKEDFSELRITDTTRYFPRELALRNENITTTTPNYFSDGIVNRDCNRVIMTIRNGNNYPTIFVATNTGVSIIDGPAGKGTVVDITDGGSVVSDICIVGDKLHISFRDYPITVVGDIPTVDQLVYASWADKYYETTSYPALLGGNSKKLANGAFGSSEGLTLIKENPMDPDNGAVNYVTTEYQSGWQQGDIKLATLADTVAETVGLDTETDLIIGGDFDDETKWLTDATWEVTGGAAVSSAVGSNGTIYQKDVFTIGKKYRVSVEILSGTGTYRIYTGSSSITEIAGVGIHTFTANAGGDNNFYIQCSGASFAGSIGSVSVVEVTEEISVPFGESALGYYDTFAVSGTNIDSAISTSAGVAYTNTLLDSLVIGNMYEITIDLTVNSGEVPYIRMGNSSAAVGDLSATMVNGFNTFTFRYDTTGFNYLWLLNTTVTNWSATISVVEVNNLVENGEFSRGNGEWDLGAGWSISGGQASIVSTGISNLSQAALTVGKTYRVTIDIESLTNRIDVYVGANTPTARQISTAGIHTFVEECKVDGTLYIQSPNTGYNATINSISVVEVTLVDGEWRTAGELVENGQFNGLVTDEWTAISSTLATVSGELQVSSTAIYGNVSHAIETVIGQVYSATLDGRVGTGSLISLNVGTTPSGIDLGIATTTSATNVTLEVTFKAVGTTTYIGAGNDASATSVSYFDNISVKPVQTLITSWDNFTNASYPNLDYDTFTTAGANITSAITAGSHGAFAHSGELGLTVGSTYKVEIEVTLNSGTAPRLSTGTSINAGGVDIPYTQLAAGTNVFTFKHNTPSEDYLWLSNNITAGNWLATTKLFELDVPDRSYKNNPLQVVGQLTKEPVATGSELVGWTGFSSENYIRQPYNSDLDFGTGDFYVMFWGIPNKTVNSFFMERVDGANFTGRLNVLALVTTGIPYMRTGGTTITGSTSMSSTEYTHIVACRRNGNLELYVNGKLDATPIASADNLTLTQPVNIGADGAGLQNADSITLFRMGAGAPSTDQIEFIYNTEKELFKENAICTLYNNDAGVTALDYDESTGKLYVAVLNGTTPKYMTFMGCENLAEGFTYQPGGAGQPVIPAYGESKAISAVGGKFLVGDGTRSYVWLPSINLREEIELASRDKSYDKSYTFTEVGTGITQVEVPEGYYPEAVYDAGLLVSFTVTTDGFRRYVSIGASTGNVTVIGRRI